MSLESFLKDHEEEMRVIEEGAKINRIKRIIEIVKERSKLRDEVIALSNQDPRFHKELLETLDRLDL